MRQIKFRGYNAKNKQWIYGFYLQNRGAHFVCPDEFANGKSWEDYEVYPESVGQFTCLKDKNGREIYEGDILNVTDTEGDDSAVAAVLFRNGVFGVENWTEDRLTSLDFFTPSKYGTETEYRIEVIGNIYDNPELLEKEDKQ